MRDPLLATGVLAVTLAACTTLPPVAAGPRSIGLNDCAVRAINFEDAYQVKTSLDPKRWSRVLAVHYGKANVIHGHAVCVFIYNNRLMSYDVIQGTRILSNNTALKADPISVAELWDPTAAIVSAQYW